MKIEHIIIKEIAEKEPFDLQMICPVKDLISKK